MIYSKNDNNGIEKKIEITNFNLNNSNISKNSKPDYSKSFESHPDINPKMKSKESSPIDSSYQKKNESVRNFYKSKTLCIFNENQINNSRNKNLTIINKKFTEKSGTFNSKPQSNVNPLNDSNLQISNNHLNIESELANHSESFNQYLYFHINNNKENKRYKLKNNKISTTKYNILTFLPKGLLLQFTRLANIFFLFTVP